MVWTMDYKLDFPYQYSYFLFAVEAEAGCLVKTECVVNTGGFRKTSSFWSKFCNQYSIYKHVL